MKKGRAWKYGENVNTDVIFPGKYTYAVMEPAEMAKHALEDLDPNFAKNVRPGDVIVAGKNFGCGSSREQAATCLKYAGVQAVIAKSFARIFYRNPEKWLRRLRSPWLWRPLVQGYSEGRTLSRCALSSIPCLVRSMGKVTLE